MKRRQSLKFLSTLPLIAIAPKVLAEAAKGGKSAESMPMLEPGKGMAGSMQYTADANKSAHAMRTDKKAFCSNCNYYNVCNAADTGCKPLSADKLKAKKAAPCQIFAGHLVAADGWCMSWQPKA